MVVTWPIIATFTCMRLLMIVHQYGKPSSGPTCNAHNAPISMVPAENQAKLATVMNEHSELVRKVGCSWGGRGWFDELRVLRMSLAVHVSAFTTNHPVRRAPRSLQVQEAVAALQPDMIAVLTPTVMQLIKMQSSHHTEVTQFMDAALQKIPLDAHNRPIMAAPPPAAKPVGKAGQIPGYAPPPVPTTTTTAGRTSPHRAGGGGTTAGLGAASAAAAAAAAGRGTTATGGKGATTVPAGVQQQQQPALPDLQVVRADADFTAQADGDVSFQEGDMLLVTRKDESGWWDCRVGDEFGVCPSNYVSPIPFSGIATVISKTALYDYAPDDPTELPFSKGDTLGLLTDVNGSTPAGVRARESGWALAMLGQRVGFVPLNYLAAGSTPVAAAGNGSAATAKPGVSVLSGPAAAAPAGVGGVAAAGVGGGMASRAVKAPGNITPPSPAVLQHQQQQKGKTPTPAAAAAAASDETVSATAVTKAPAAGGGAGGGGGGGAPDFYTNPSYATYARLLKMGMPAEHIKMKMSMDGVDPNALPTPGGGGAGEATAATSTPVSATTGTSSISARGAPVAAAVPPLPVSSSAPIPQAASGGASGSASARSTGSAVSTSGGGVTSSPAPGSGIPINVPTSSTAAGAGGTGAGKAASTADTAAASGGGGFMSRMFGGGGGGNKPATPAPPAAAAPPPPTAAAARPAAPAPPKAPAPPPPPSSSSASAAAAASSSFTPPPAGAGPPRGAMLAGIQGFKKDALRKAETIEKGGLTSTTAAGGGSGGFPAGGGGGGQGPAPPPPPRRPGAAAGGGGGPMSMLDEMRAKQAAKGKK